MNPKSHLPFLLNATLSLGFSFSLFAQSQIKGRVLDEAGRPAFEVNVMEAQTQLGTITDRKGNFSLNLSQTPSTILIYAAAYRTQFHRIPANDTAFIAITLEHKSDEADYALEKTPMMNKLVCCGGVKRNVVDYDIQDSIIWVSYSYLERNQIKALNLNLKPAFTLNLPQGNFPFEKDRYNNVYLLASDSAYFCKLLNTEEQLLKDMYTKRVFKRKTESEVAVSDNCILNKGNSMVTAIYSPYGPRYRKWQALSSSNYTLYNGGQYFNSKNALKDPKHKQLNYTNDNIYSRRKLRPPSQQFTDRFIADINYWITDTAESFNKPIYSYSPFVFYDRFGDLFYRKKDPDGHGSILTQAYIIQDLIYIFNLNEDSIYVFNKSGQRLKHFKFRSFNPDLDSGPLVFWNRELILNEEHTKVFFKFERENIIRIKEVNLETGWTSSDFQIQNFFSPSIFRIKGNYVYFMAKEKGIDRRLLYREKME